MEYFYGGGGNTRPSFAYGFIVKRVTNDMWTWAEGFPLNGPFERWHVIHNYRRTDDGDLGDSVEIPLVQFESKTAARIFRLAFSEYIIENKCIYSLDD